MYMNSYIKNLILTNYRTYKNIKLSFSSGINIICGKNGIGKTNILESISFLSPGKGFLGDDISEILNNDTKSGEWCVFADIANNMVDTISVFSEDRRKKIKINNNLVRSQEELARIFNIIWLIPQMQNFFNDDKSLRRKFLDTMVYNIDTQHSSRVAKYEFLVKERMKILQGEVSFDKNWISILEQKIAEVGVAIATARNAVVQSFNKISAQSDFSFPKITITIDGYFENLLLGDVTSLYIEKKFSEVLNFNRDKDKETKRTNEGTHKSDLRVFYQDKHIDAQFCSSGEQKLFLVSIAILRVLLSKQLKKSATILLLDEVFSYLDADKQTELFNELQKLDVQSFITGTDINLFERLAHDKKDINIIRLDLLRGV